MIPICFYDPKCNQLLKINLPVLQIVMSGGLKKHIAKNHPDCLQYMPDIREIITSPDYVGHNPKEPDSVEYVKQLGANLLVAVKLDAKNNRMYVASLYDISPAKLSKRIASGRLVRFR